MAQSSRDGVRRRYSLTDRSDSNVFRPRMRRFAEDRQSSPQSPLQPEKKRRLHASKLVHIVFKFDFKRTLRSKIFPGSQVGGKDERCPN